MTAEDASVVTLSLETGTGYTVDSDANSAMVTVEDNDAAPTGPADDFRHSAGR